MQQVVEGVDVTPELRDYIVDIARATREDDRVQHGVSPRGTQRLFENARARALLAGRRYVTPDDVKTAASPVLDHRVVLTPNARVEDLTGADVVADVLDRTPVPTVEGVTGSTR
jgi:MoxR-like ATPase